MEWSALAVNLLIAILAGVIANFLSLLFFRTRVRHPVLPSYVSSIWSIVVVLYVVVALFLVEERWLMPVKYRVLVVTMSFLLILLLTYLLRLMRRKPWQELLIIFVIPAVLIYAVDPLFPRGITIECPPIVTDDATVKGLVSRENWKINVLVHPIKTPDWWVQQVPIPDQGRRWEARAVFGGSSGDQFEVLAIAIPEGSLFKEGEVIHPEQIPRSVFRSKICQVQRKQDFP
jgi:hypothetical protein